ncbi:hypothetical protein DCC39_13975 [Pueribacillus theae]|uniref:ABC transporter permease n=1 Tax=Pueribacillus theae TaxID=2171751 RepID=A0A2U1JVL6_9BACI|nr:hypothetical protein [Pueribacillus theae]PWA08868.1 hypothetical protein DCC39_13975 [Pueribacillus theae]
MRGFIRYQFISYIRSLKMIPPLTVFGLWVIILYTYKDVPILSSYAVTSIAIYLIMAWITMSIFSIEGESEKHILFMQLGSKLRYLWGKWAICLFAAIILIIFSIFYPILMNNFREAIQPIHFGLSIYNHFILALFGIFVGTFFSVTSFASKKYTWLSAILVIVVSISYSGLVEKVGLLKWGLLLFPPVMNVIKYLNGEDMVHIGQEFWLAVLWGLTYTVVGFIVILKMFLLKER